VRDWQTTDWGLLRRLTGFAWPHRRSLAVSLCLLPVVSGFQLVQPYLLKLAIDGPIAERDPAGLVPIAALLMVVLLCEYGLQFVQALASHVAGQGIVHDLRVAVHGHMLRLNDRYFRSQPAGRLLTRCTSDVEGIGEMFAAGFLTLFADVVLLVGICVALVLLNPHLALVTFVTLPILVGGSQWFQSRLRATYRELRRRVAMLNSYLAERISGIAVIQLFAREARSYSEFEKHSRRLMDENFRSIRLDATLFAFVDSMAHVVTALLLWVSVGPILDPDGALTLGALVAFLDYVSRFFRPIRDMSQKVATLQSGLASSERVFALLDEDSVVSEAEEQLATSVGFHESKGLIEFDSVGFEYAEGEPVLRGLSLAVRPAESVALLGVTGAGKTTALRLLNRLYDVQSGSVRIDGRDVREWSLSRLRKTVGIVPQDVFLFMGSFRDNVTLGEPDLSDADVWRALEAVGAADLVRSMGGLDASLGERGENLSSGERQLIAFARVMAYDPAILILDEATSSLDTFSEERVQAAIATAMVGRTSIVVAHRLSTIHAVDRIAVLQSGVVAEEGSHRELLTRGGLYRRLYDSYFKLSPGAEVRTQA